MYFYFKQNIYYIYIYIYIQGVTEISALNLTSNINR